VAVERRERRPWRGRDREPLERARVGHLEDALVDPAAGREVAQGRADDDVVAAHRSAGGDVDERDLVALRHAVDEREAVVEHGAGVEPAVVGDDRDIVARVHPDPERRRRSLLCHGGTPQESAGPPRDRSRGHAATGWRSTRTRRG